MMNFIDRKFQIWGYTTSHRFLVLRSPQRFPDQDDYNDNYNCNVDVEFTAVAYMEIPTFFDGIIIREVKGSTPDRLKCYEVSYGLKMFELETMGGKYYIVAGAYLVGSNSWSLQDDRIKNGNLQHDQILAASD